MQGELGPPRAGLFILPFAKKKKHLVSSAPSLGRSSQELSGGAASELQGRRGGVFSRPGPTGNNPPPGRRDAGEALTWKPDPATQIRSPAASLREKSLPRLHDWISSPTPTAWSRSTNDNTEERRKSRPARLIGPHPKVEESHWATELLAKAPSQSHAGSSCLLRSSSERCPVRGVAFLASWPVLSGREGQGRAGWGGLLERGWRICFWRGKGYDGWGDWLWNTAACRVPHRSGGRGVRRGSDREARASWPSPFWLLGRSIPRPSWRATPRRAWLWRRLAAFLHRTHPTRRRGEDEASSLPHLVQAEIEMDGAKANALKSESRC